MNSPRPSDLEAGLSWAHPLIQTWFKKHIGLPTEPQREGWPAILEGKDTLISAPTGSGKTFAAFLVCLDALVRQALEGNLPQATTVLYVSPLKALGNDIQKNLLLPLEQIQALAKEQHLSMQAIHVSVRTGDTPQKERQAMLRMPPHILVTTPESLYLLLTAEKSRQNLKSIHTLILDEIHAVLSDKRGAHLALSLERLEALVPISPLRIGLSATQRPLSTVAHFLAGNDRKAPEIIAIGHLKQVELAIEQPKTRLEAVASNQQWEEIYDRLAELIQTHRSVLIFANTRRVAERTAHHLAERLSPELVATHHGSLSKKLRLNAETRLKKGELKALVATASLELGIDIGHIDLVCQLGSPRSISVMLQRLGRAGHWHGAVSKGRLFATTRDELLECAALVKAIYAEDLDTLVVPKEPLDVLAQQIVAAASTEDWTIDRLFALVRRAYHYQHLSKTAFLDLIKMLSEGISGARGRYAVYLFYDPILGLIKAKRGARMTALMNGGAIPDNALFSVVIDGTETIVGTLDEEFAVESHRGDIFLLGSTSWRIKQLRATEAKIFVEDAKGASPTVPFWQGEAPERSAELSRYVSRLRQDIAAESVDATIMPQLEKNYHLDAYGASQLWQYVKEGQALLGAVPTQSRVIAERFFDEAGGMQLIIHAPFGARINKAWGLGLRKCFCRFFNIELQAAATDNGLHIALTQQHSFPLEDVFRFLRPQSFKKNLEQAVLQSPIFASRWRWDAGRALALVRVRNGKKRPPHILRIIANDLLAAVFPDAAACQDNLAGKDMVVPDHPLVNEAMKDALFEALNLEGMLHVLKDIEAEKIQCLAIDTLVPSVFAQEILNANPFAYLDDAPLEERRARAVQMRHILPESVLQNLARLDLDVIRTVQKQAWPDIRDADELQDFLQRVLVFPKASLQKEGLHWQGFLELLKTEGRILEQTCEGEMFCFSPGNETLFASAYGQREGPLDQNESIFQIIRAWLPYLGPVSAQNLSEELHLPKSAIEQALLRIEASGMVLRGKFHGLEEEWCERQLLARIHRLTLEKLRKEISAVPAKQFAAWSVIWQHRSLNARLQGERGLLEIIEQLQGFEAPAKFWEKEIFAPRLKDYAPQLLDRLCLMGMVGWGRFSSPAHAKEEGPKRVVPTSLVPIAFFVRKEGFIKKLSRGPAQMALSPVAERVASYLQSFGAAFLFEIVEGTGHLRAEVEMALWELVTLGLATADSFDNLRALIDPKRRLRKKRQHFGDSGRWSLLKASSSEAKPATEGLCWILLKRYGIVFRDVLAKEKLMPPWRELLMCFRTLEAQGEIRGGRFVEGFSGEQFAAPYALASLRAFKGPYAGSEESIVPYDPLALLSSLDKD